MSTAHNQKVLVFGGFRLDAAKRGLFDEDGAPIDLPSRAFELLLFMASRPGQMLEKATLMEAVWPRTVVEESNLSQSIYLLRRALGEQAGEQKFIATIPGRGYQFVAPVEFAEPEATSKQPAGRETPASRPEPRRPFHRWKWAVGILAAALLVGAIVQFWQPAGSGAKVGAKAAAAQQPTTHRIAILPFEDLSPSRDMEYFADGLVDELISSIATAKNLSVIGRRSAFALKGTKDDARTIGRKLNVEAILKGSVRAEGDAVRISVLLVRTRDEIALLAQTFNVQKKDTLATRTRISRHIVATLDKSFATSGTGQVTELTRTSEGPAYDAYLHGLYFYGRRTTLDFDHARDAFERACDLDPGFAMAHAWLARTYNALASRGLGDVSRNESLGLAALNRALALDPAIGDLWWVNDFVLGPNTPLELRASKLERALHLTPSDTEALTTLGKIYVEIGQREDAFRAFERAHKMDPLWAQGTQWLGIMGYMFKGDRQVALESAAEITALSASDPRGPTTMAWVAMNEGSPVEWDRATARSVAAAPLDNTTHFYISKQYADLGLRDAALHHARITRETSPDSAAGWYATTRVLLAFDDIAGARKYAREAMASKPADYQSLFSQAELQYHEGDCSGAVRSMILARPALAQPPPSLLVMPDVDLLPILAWCQRQLGNPGRAQEITQSVRRVLAPPMCPGLMEGHLARIAAANGDRPALIAHLAALVKTRAFQPTFTANEPMIRPYLRDPEVSALLGKMAARAAEWRKALPGSSTRVPVPGITAGYLGS
jgi:adenylate cyclase